MRQNRLRIAADTGAMPNFGSGRENSCNRTSVTLHWMDRTFDRSPMRIAHPLSANSSAIAFRQIEISDIPDWYRYLSIPRAVEQTSWTLQSADDLKPAMASYDSNEESSPIRFAVSQKPNGKIIGTAGFHSISTPHRTAEIAYDFAPEYWGRGLATACCNALVEWGFAQRNYVRIQATTLETNAASVRVLEKCGFVLEGKMRSFRIVRGVPRDFWLYARTSD
jgi:ribosomal-protein-alanine N-acetyltransferase